ncbi:MAG: hypothetical protein F6K10_23430 [Moorea sp. SIO2B7]|nr:hypothetical protein [Moorena sp. SIO2B7]
MPLHPNSQSRASQSLFPIPTKRNIDDNTADIRELMLENQRILRYLESIVNRE